MSRWALKTKAAGGDAVLRNLGALEGLEVDGWLRVERIDERSWRLRVGDARLYVTLEGAEQAEVDVERGVHGVTRGKHDTFRWERR